MILKNPYVTGWWFGTCFIFPCIGNVISPTDELIFFRGVGIPPTRLAVDADDHNRDHMFEVSSGMCKMCHAVIDHHSPSLTIINQPDIH